MLYLIRTHKGIYLVKARSWNDACRKGRASFIADVDKGMEMLGGFPEAPVGDAHPLNHTGIVITAPDLLKKAIEMYAQACVNDSWKGGGDPADFPEIERKLKDAEVLLKDLTDLDFAG